MCSCEDGEQPQVFAQRYRKARRSQCCSECRNAIPCGTWYLDINGLWGDNWDDFKQCLRCHARYEAWAAIECHCVMTQLLESIAECLVSRDTWLCHETGKRIVCRHIDRSVGRPYLVALRAARAHIASEVNALSEAQRSRYRAAGLAREASKRLLAVPNRAT